MGVLEALLHKFQQQQVGVYEKRVGGKKEGKKMTTKWKGTCSFFISF